MGERITRRVDPAVKESRSIRNRRRTRLAEQRGEIHRATRKKNEVVGTDAKIKEQCSKEETKRRTRLVEQMRKSRSNLQEETKRRTRLLEQGASFNKKL
jgi:hypothetical protein